MAKTDFDAKLSSRNRKINSNKSKHLLVENELKKLKTFYSIYYSGKNHFEEDGTQNLERKSWKSKGLSDENITAPTTSDL